MLPTKQVPTTPRPVENQLEQILQLCHQVHACSDEELQAKLHQMGFKCPAELVCAVRLLLNGSMYLHEQLAQEKAEAAPPAPPQALAAALSEREREVLLLVAKGYTLPRIGAKLFISPATVNNHCARMREKLGLRGRNALVQYAVETKA